MLFAGPTANPLPSEVGFLVREVGLNRYGRHSHRSAGFEAVTTTRAEHYALDQHGGISGLEARELPVPEPRAEPCEGTASPEEENRRDRGRESVASASRYQSGRWVISEGIVIRVKVQ